ncbi:MAG: hypothetical protein H6822_18340 [Planctomycetaceae bacterium]|nr:hypothetical protein [Planctomycetales bacterium]MCB9924146.1 hypothetical protein [Planctomycetaceae bacterium]
MRKFVMTAAMFAMVLAISSSAFAQRDSGAKARGDHDGFWSPRYSQHHTSGSSRSFFRRSTVRLTPVRQSAPIVASPQVAEQAPSTAPQATVPVAATPTTSNARVPTAGTFLGSGSYSSNSSRSTSKPVWMYQKTDPRRYHH